MMYTIANKDHYMETNSVSEPLNNPTQIGEAVRLSEEGNTLYLKLRFKEAEPLLQQALEIREKVLGSDHLDTAVSLIDLALLYKDQGQFERAKPLFQRALKIIEKLLGSKQLFTVIILNNLAEIYRAQSLDEKAALLFRRAMSIRAKLKTKTL